MYVNGHQVIQVMEQLAPKVYAVENDRIGLQLGTLNKPIRNVLVALDVTMAVVEEAIAVGANLIIAHHAIIFRPLAKLDFSTPAGQLYEKLIKHDIAVYISHTNLDVAPGGLNDWMADLVGIQAEGRANLDVVYSEQLYKLAVYVPVNYEDVVLQAMWKAGAGHIGQYSECSFRFAGTATFQPMEGTNPFIGQQGQRETLPEVRLEVVVPHRNQRAVVQALKKVHPYEEVAYDLFVEQYPAANYGLGRVGKLAETIVLRDYVQQVKAALDVPFARVVGDLNRPIKKVAVLGGSGARYVSKAQFAGADVIITGDIDYHTAHDALVAGIAIVDVGHNVEKLMKSRVADWLNVELQALRKETRAVASQIDTEVFQLC